MKKTKIALTGGIGCGKSTAIACLRDMGYPVFSCDDIYKKIIVTPDYIEKVAEIFPIAVREGSIDRGVLSEIVFNDPLNRRKLNEIAHPLIMSTLLKDMDNCAAELVFAEVPLLFEGNFENLFDRVIVLTRDKTERITSVQKRDNLSSTEIAKRIEAQFDYFSEEGKRRMEACHAVILKNNGSIEALSSELKKIISNF